MLNITPTTTAHDILNALTAATARQVGARLAGQNMSESEWRERMEDAVETNLIKFMDSLEEASPQLAERFRTHLLAEAEANQN